MHIYFILYDLHAARSTSLTARPIIAVDELYVLCFESEKDL